MSNPIQDPPYRCLFSLKPLIDYWAEIKTASDPHGAQLAETIKSGLVNAPELLQPIEDFSVLETHRDLVRTLMSAVLPRALWDTGISGVVVPFTLRPVFVSPKFRTLFVNNDGSFRGRVNVKKDEFLRVRLIRFYLLILKQFYGVEKELEYPLVTVVQDLKTGLDRHFQMSPDLRFIDVRKVGSPPSLTDADVVNVIRNLNDPAAFLHLFPPENYELHGFTVMQAADVTLPEVMSALERDLIDSSGISSKEGFGLLQDRLRTLLSRPELKVHLAVVKNDQVLLLNSGGDMNNCCIFANSRHVDINQFNGSFYDRAVQGDGIFSVRDLVEAPVLTGVDEKIVEEGIRSMMVAPLRFQGQLIGVLEVGSPNPDDFGPGEELVLSQILPLFSMAVNRSLEELENRIDAVIKEQCTAIHPSVEWRFRKAALRHLEHLGDSDLSGMGPIVFKDVFPLYGASDIRGSSELRNRAIQSDLVEHLCLALDIVHAAAELTSMPIINELSFRTERQLEMVENGLGTGDLTSILKFLRNELEPIFPRLRNLGRPVTDQIETYQRAMDSSIGMVYSERKNFERSISLFNQRISSYLEHEEAVAQSTLPHYFNKHQTDGVDYIIYIGASMIENGAFDILDVRNLRLWQLMVACGIAWHAADVRKLLEVPLDATHLILVNHSSVSIRFRFDEKRFDVDGAYDVGHEIIRSRIDKATVKGRDERLTQPGKIAIVYSRPNEYQEMNNHISFLQGQDYLNDDLESLELDDLPGVQGLRALRVGVKLESTTLASRLNKLAP